MDEAILALADLEGESWSAWAAAMKLHGGKPYKVIGG